MPAATALPPQQGTANPAGGASAAQVIPFAQASHHGCEQGPSFTFTPSTNQQTFGPFPLPATGYLRRIVLEFSTTTPGTGGTASNDYPHSLSALIRLTDTNGAPIYELSGYNTLLADTYGGYAGSPDYRIDPDYSSSATAPALSPYVPLEISPDGVGSPANLSASSAYRLTVLIDTLGNNFSTPPSPVEAMSCTVWCEFWSLPAPTDARGRQQAVAPPYSGTMGLWSQQPNITVNPGSQRLPLNRMGNLLRTVIVVFRVAGVRSDAVTGDPVTLRWDDINLDVTSRRMFRKRMREYVNDLTARDVGVYVFGLYNYGVERNVGGLSVVSWLPTVTSTRYEVNTPSGGSAGTIDWIINDVTVSSTAPDQRAAVGGSGVQFHPPVAPVIPGAA